MSIAHITDFLWLGRHHHGGFIILLAIIQFLAKLGSTYFTYDIYSNAEGGADGLGEYRTFGGGQRDPFNRGGGDVNTTTTIRGGVNGGGGSLSPVGYTPPPPGAMPDEPPSPTGMPPPQQQQQQDIGTSLL